MDNDKVKLLAQLLQKKEQVVVSAPVTAKIDVEYKHEDKTVSKIKEEKVEIDRKYFGENPVRVWVDYSHTIPMRPYESAKVSVGLSIPVGVDLPDWYVKEIHNAHSFAIKFIEEKIEKEVKAINDFLVKQGK